MDSPMKDVCQEPQQKDQPAAYQSISHEVDDTEERPITVEGQLQQSLHSQREEHQHDTPEALFHQEQVLQDNQEQQIKEKCIHQNEEHLQETHKLKTQCNQEKQVQESKEFETQCHILEEQIQLSQEVQAEKQVQDVQTWKSQELQAHQIQEMQIQEGQEMQLHLTQELETHPHQEQQTPTAAHTHQSLSAPQQRQQNQSLHNQPKTHQLSEKDLQQRQQEQHYKKLKKKLVGENQERINYLVQASQAMALTAGSPAAIPDLKALASQVGSLASAVGRRCVLRIAPALKRCLCKGCGTSLVYGLNARVRHRSRRQKHLVVTCLTCHTIKRFVSDPKHKLWFEEEEAVA